VRELVRASRVVGWRRLLELRRAQKQVWPPLINGFVLTRTVQALLNVGFFDELQQRGTVNIDAFAAAQGLDGEILRPLCEALYASRILDRGEAAYSLTRQGRTMVTTGRGWFDGVYGYEPVYTGSRSCCARRRCTAWTFHGSPITSRAAAPPPRHCCTFRWPWT
jgi:hypothetical protein